MSRSGRVHRILHEACWHPFGVRRCFYIYTGGIAALSPRLMAGTPNGVPFVACCRNEFARCPSAHDYHHVTAFEVPRSE